MPENDWVEKAAESGDWASDTEKAASSLRKSGAKIRRAHAPRPEPEVIGRFEGIEADSPELAADDSEDLLQEYIDDPPSEEEEDAALPTAGQEKALDRGVEATPDGVIKRTLRQQRKERKAELAARAEAERQRILAQQTERKGRPKPYWQKEQEELERRRAEEAKARTIQEVELEDAEEEAKWWARFDTNGIWHRPNWAGVSNFRRPDPPPDPPDRWAAKQRIASSDELWHHKHRGILSALERPDGRRLRFGNPPRLDRSVENPYYGFEPNRQGRPSKPNKLTNAQKQMAYRERLSAQKGNR